MKKKSRPQTKNRLLSHCQSKTSQSNKYFHVFRNKRSFSVGINVCKGNFLGIFSTTPRLMLFLSIPRSHQKGTKKANQVNQYNGSYPQVVTFFVIC